jgi:hypothetical protein
MVLLVAKTEGRHNIKMVLLVAITEGRHNINLNVKKYFIEFRS